MAPSRAYIPSVAVLRALTRPVSPRCPLVRRIPTQCLRGKRTQAADRPPKPLRAPPGYKESTFGEQLGDGVSSISWYEQDLDARTPERLISRIETQEDLARHRKQWQMFEEDESNPNYDDTELKRSILEDMMVDPNFADLRDQLEAMKGTLMTPEERAKMEAEVDKELQPELDDLDATMTMATHESIQELIDDPELAEAREDLLDFQNRLPEWKEGGAEFEEVAERLNDKLGKLPAFQRRIAAQKESGTTDGRTPDEIIPAEGEDVSPNTADDLDTLLKQMQEVMVALDGDKELAGELEDVLSQDPMANIEDEIDEELDLGALADQITKMKDTPPPEEVEESKEDPKLEALVDKIMEDPQLLKKLAMIKELIAKRKDDVTMLDQPSAPDPETLDKTQLTTYRERLRVAENDPEHIAALRRLRVNLLPPFNISPALKAFNDALKLSYLGASDDVRRILWRTYNKARTIPTLLQNIPDDAWDMLWYSQAVTWGSNQNRQNHLRILLHDLSRVGKDGPPTHPDTLAALQ